MNRNIVFMYIAVSLVMLVPVPGRLYYGIPVIMVLNLLMVLTTLFSKFMDFFKFYTLKPICILLMLVGITIFARQLLILYSPMIALTMGFIIYMPAIAVLMLGRFFDNRGMQLKMALSGNMRESGFFSIYAFVFFLLRDIVGYGTISFPIPSGIFKLELPTLSYFSPFTFWASIPGALVLSGLLLAALSFIRKYCGILERSAQLRQEESNAN
ncbi:MAG: hypothetical protein PUH08_09080 [Treponema sp.]|nr:hypothetical protein [Spirochaetia bacterium]MDD7275808.1 hypothetical protein [Treponema sp.]MDY3754999.1 hypothetical protein [Treponema sp.]MDY4675357.1 hypothetical protein [Treponema sp.]